jgi:hypothetical protein
VSTRFRLFVVLLVLLVTVVVVGPLLAAADAADAWVKADIADGDGDDDDNRSAAGVIGLETLNFFKALL